MTTLTNEIGFELLQNFETAYNAVRKDEDNYWNEFVERSIEVNNDNNGTEDDLTETAEDGIRQMISENGSKIIHHEVADGNWVKVVARDEEDAEIAAQDFLDEQDDNDKYHYTAKKAYEIEKFVYKVRYDCYER
jgi:hypothetical protein